MPKVIHRPRKKDSQGKEVERRGAQRLSSGEIPAMRSTRLLAGPEVELINLSRGGALLQSDTRISPGAKVGIRLMAGDAVILLRGFVLRSRVSELKGPKLIYEWAIAFDEACSLFNDREGFNQKADDANAAMILEEAVSSASENWMTAGGEEEADLITVTVPLPKSGDTAARLAKSMETPGIGSNSGRA